MLKNPNLPSFFEAYEVGKFWVAAGIEHAEQALAILETSEETERMLGPTAPQMGADSFHSLIWQAAAARWEVGHYSDAVQRAATALSSEIKNRTDRHDLGDSDLITQVFSLDPPKVEKPRLRWPGKDSDRTVKAMRDGILNTAKGVFSAVRNPVTHSTEELPQQVALEQLAALSMLARWVEECELVEV